MKPISLIIVEDHAILRENLALALENSKEFSVMGHFKDAGEALAFLKTSTVDVAIIDYSLPDMNGISFLREALRIAPDLKGLFLSMYCDGDKIQEAFRQGAMGYVRKTSGTNELMEAIKQIMNGEPFLSPSLTSSLITSITAPSKVEEYPLSGEQMTILSLAGKGKATKEIAQEMGLTVATVKHRFNEIFRLLGVHSRAQALLKASSIGLISVEV